jgi:subfamily B ATP-binding cassette protein MsbA
VNSESRQLYARLLGYLRPHAHIFALSVAGMMLAAATEPLFPALIKPLLDGGFGARGAPTLSPALFAGAILGVFLVRGLLTFFSSYCLHWVSHRLVLDLRGAMFGRLVRSPSRFFDEQSSGALLSKVAYDVSGVTAAATSVIQVVVKDTIAVVGLLGWLLYLNWKLTLIALLVGPDRVVREAAVEAPGQHARRAENGGDGPRVGGNHLACGHQDLRRADLRRAASRATQLLRASMRLVVPEALITPVTHMLASWLCPSSSTCDARAVADRARVGESLIPHPGRGASRSRHAGQVRTVDAVSSGRERLRHGRHAGGGRPRHGPARARAGRDRVPGRVVHVSHAYRACAFRHRPRDPSG